ncbi:MAG: hypothetical protein CVU15_10630 [Betaproteobacteria bacterium HGW-Betaproteobacteria-1]|nr:MAG: hypothetical protein CVU15_10630 [Betaproteobacteria bacterium HGW-Betaproteobacteria-1]
MRVSQLISDAENYLCKALTVASVLLTLAIAIYAIYFAGFGYDFTDEGFYLNWISDPFNLGVGLTQFGYVYHPIYLLSEGNVQLLRLINIGITFALGALLFDALFKFSDSNSSIRFGDRLILTAGMSLSSLIVFDTWLVIPNYNSLNLQALMLSFLAVLKISQKDTSTEYRYWVLLGAAIWLVYMAKPSSAVLVVISLILYLSISKNLDWRGLLFCASTAFCLFLIGAVIVSGSIPDYLNGLQSSYELSQVLGSAHNLSGFWKLHGVKLHPEVKEILIYSSLLSATVYFFSISRTKYLRIVSLIIIFVIACYGFYVLLGGDNLLPARKFQSILMSFALISTLACVLAMVLNGIKPDGGINWSLFLLALFIPYIYTFGTGSYYFHVGSRALVFWVMASLMLLLPINNKRVINLFYSFVITVQVMSIILLRTGVDAPYRQPQPLFLNEYQLVMENGAKLMLPSAAGSYVTEVKDAAFNNNFKAGSPILDLTGQSPGLVFLLGGRPLGAAWILGGYPRSDDFARKAFEKVSCVELASAWLIYEPSGPRSISSDVINSFGADIKRDYKEVDEFVVPSGTGGRKQSQKQYLLKPARELSSAVRACEQARENRS